MQTLPASLEKFIQQHRIDSFHKIWFLLFLHQHTEQQQSNREYIRQVTFTDAPTLDEMIEELQQSGLLTATGELLRLGDAPDMRRELDALAHVFAEPIVRQELLRKLYRRATVPLMQSGR